MKPLVILATVSNWKHCELYVGLDNQMGSKSEMNVDSKFLGTRPAQF